MGKHINSLTAELKKIGYYKDPVAYSKSFFKYVNLGKREFGDDFTRMKIEVEVYNQALRGQDFVIRSVKITAVDTYLHITELADFATLRKEIALLETFPMWRDVLAERWS